ncbi:MAG: cysteine--tRNA ligase [Candidatus Dojkabacteria bacterium]
MKIQNTLGKELEEFRPLHPGKVSFYHCGPTVYWTQHIGNMRGMVMADLVRRTLQYLGYEVKFVRNYTDVGHLTGDNLGDADSGEDRMEKGAKREGLSPQEIADKYIIQFDQDTQALNILEPTSKPRATMYVQEMIDMVGELLEKGFAYSTPKAIYFDVTKKADYTKLSGQKLEKNIAGAGAGEVEDPEKKNSQDFALWFFRTGVHKNALQWWSSPFDSPEVENGAGFPGWHIECSAMARADLGDTIDIHMGGIEHIPVHHTNEIAQSESVTGKTFANYWLHNEWLMIDGEKISKSLGNFYSVDDLSKKGYEPLALRYLFLQAHYRSQQNFTFEALDGASSAYEKLKSKLARLSDGGKINQEYKEKFIASISDDFNIPAALALVWDLLRDEAINSEDKKATILDFDEVMGLGLDNLETGAKSELDPNTISEIEELIAKRDAAREEKDFELADKIRDELLEKYGVSLKDEGGKTSWGIS